MKEISDIFGRSGYTTIDMMAEAHYMEDVLREIECDISYLEDAPDEMLAPYDDKFDRICERLRKLDDYRHNERNVIKI